MDLNHDQMVAMNVLYVGALPARIFDALNRAILCQASAVIGMDRFIRERVLRKLDVAGKVHAMPPWPHQDQLENVAHADNEFRRQHVADVRFAVMYSGNHSPANPLSTLLDAAERMQCDPRLLVMCIGAGGGKKDVDDCVARGGVNTRSMPCQHFGRIRFSLSAADVHVVSIADEVVGFLHPCKV